MEVALKPIVFRASYRDLNLILSITNKALDSYKKSEKNSLQADEAPAAAQQSQLPRFSNTMTKARRTVGNAHILMCKEQVSKIQNLLFCRL